MKFFELVRFALGAIIAHPMRSVLTSLGVVIGVAAVVMMTSIGLGASKRVTDAISGLGSNLIIVMPNFQRGPVAQAAGGGNSLRDGDADAIQTRDVRDPRDAELGKKRANPRERVRRVAGAEGTSEVELPCCHVCPAI